ncbi:hypothetical protein BLD44_018235 [Mastigocladus laminosus UU774]|nr:hypothetical protein B4U84_02290 [Westiellopsis prolifica IICB1]TFI52669.1 hypothetical protein BLD44_018235 [Mastigocladus laminosus UU774]
MALKFRVLGGLLVVLTTAIAIPTLAQDQAQTLSNDYVTPNEAFEQAYFKNSPDFFGSITSQSDVNDIFGLGSFSRKTFSRNTFPENQIARDSELVHILYQDILHQQVSNDPYLRSPDLPNPYNTSLLMSPGLNANKLKVGTEFRFEQMPRR